MFRNTAEKIRSFATRKLLKVNFFSYICIKVFKLYRNPNNKYSCISRERQIIDEKQANLCRG